jgi:hypothetical protein
MIIIVYGFLSPDINHIARTLEGILNINFELHASSYRGGDYYLYKKGVPWKEKYYLQNNLELDDELAEPEHPDYKLILYIYIRDDKNIKELHEKITSESGEDAVFLRKRVARNSIN